MPFLQVMANRASEAFSYDNLDALKIGTIRADARLANVLETLNIVRSDAERAAIEAFPPALQQIIVSVLRHALPTDTAKRKQITVSWAPAYEHAVHVWEARAVGGSPAAITLHLEGPYPQPPPEAAA